MTCNEMTRRTAQTLSGPSLQRRRVHPLTWVGLVMLIPFACWDVIQARLDVQLRHEASAQHVQHAAFALRTRDNAGLSHLLASR